MPINSPHPLYTANIGRWKRCRDAYEGEDAVKEAATDYLPKISGDQTSREYEAYKARASYYEAVGRTVDGFVGAICRKPHVVDLPPGIDVFVKDATADGTPLDEFIKKLCAEDLLIGRCGVLVDFDDKKNRAYLSCYQAESILSWSADGVVLSETVYEADPSDPQAQKAIDQIRQLHIVDGRYTVTIWRKAYNVTTGSEWSVYSETTPAKRGAPFTEIPWVWISTMGQSDKIEKPVLLGLVNISYSHYRTTADLEHGRHFTALPTLYVTGVQSDTTISVGGGAVITLTDPASKAGYAEFTGAGLKSLESGLEMKQQQMATLGAAIWGARKGIEAAETARMRVAGENSLLMGIVSAVESGIAAALEIAADWMSVVGDIVLQINRDFIDQKIDAQTLVGMVQAFQAGAMSLESFVYCLQQSEMLPPETEIEEEVEKLNAAQVAKTAAAAKVAAQIAKPPGPVDLQNPGGDK